MSDKIKIKVIRRTDFGKGYARQARRAGLIARNRRGIQSWWRRPAAKAP